MSGFNHSDVARGACCRLDRLTTNDKFRHMPVHRYPGQNSGQVCYNDQHANNNQHTNNYQPTNDDQPTNIDQPSMVLSSERGNRSWHS
jgi:hypothetical protein